MKTSPLLPLCIVGLMPVVMLGCPKKDPPPPAVDAAPAPTPTQTETVLAPLEEDASVADASEAGAKVYKGGPGLSANQMRAKQCCSALRAQAKTMGSSPEAVQLGQAALMCDQVAMQLGGSANSPEFAPVRQLLAGKTIPPVCQGL